MFVEQGQQVSEDEHYENGIVMSMRTFKILSFGFEAKLPGKDVRIPAMK